MTNNVGPEKPAPVRQDGSAPGDVAASARPSVLLVDDSVDNLVLLERLLDDLELNLIRAKSGEEALRAVLDGNFALILLDVRMPVMDGFETARCIRTRAAARHIPIIFVTGMDSPDHLARGYSAGAVDYLFRPFSAEILRSKVRFFIEVHRQREDLARANRELRQEIAERRRLEEERDRMGAQLLQGQKLQAIGQLAAGIAHEINNPVGYILSNLGSLGRCVKSLGQLLEEARAVAARGAQGTDGRAIADAFESLWRKVNPGFLISDLESALTDCRGGGERIRDIVRGLKDFAHADESVLKEVDLTEVIERAIELCLNELKYGVTLHRHYAGVGTLVCYPQQIEQVLVNLLVNAAQALVGGKGDVRIEGRREGQNVILAVHDTGAGILPEHRRRLFEPFFTTKPVGKGTGLGLHVVYKIVKAHRGQIDVQSEPGKGSTFTLSIPAEGPGKRE